jgi:hypothetical protein
MMMLWSLLAVLFVATPTAMGAMLWAENPPPNRRPVLEFRKR